jgi:hypothetical protein
MMKSVATHSYSSISNGEAPAVNDTVVSRTLTRLEIQAIDESRGVLFNALRTGFKYSAGEATNAVDQAALKMSELLKCGLRPPHYIHILLHMSRLAHEMSPSCGR